MGVQVDASAFYPSIEDEYGTGTLPFLRVGDVDGFIDVESCIRIPADLTDRYPTLCRVRAGDVLFTKGGAIDRVGLVSAEAAVSRDLIFLTTSRMAATDRQFLFAYFCTPLFKRMLVRSSSQTAQPHLTVTLVRDLPLFMGSPTLKQSVSELVSRAFDTNFRSIRSLKDAEAGILLALGLENWTPSEPLSYTSSSKSAFASGRLDAQFYRPKFEEIVARLRSTERTIELGKALLANSRGRQPSYADDGLPVINSKHVRINRVELDDDNRFAVAEPGSAVIQRGDVLLNGTGVGTIGRAAPYLREKPALPDNHVTVLRATGIDPIYLSVFLNSLPGQMQIEQLIKGSSGQIELYPDDIAKIVVWNAPKKTQEKVRDQVLAAFAQEHKANYLLDTAKRAVEIAIEDSEKAALRFLKDAEAGGS